MVQAISTTSGSGHLAGGTLRRIELLQSLGRKIDGSDPHAARAAAALTASQLFFAPLLSELRKFPFGKEIGHGGRMEEAFAEQLDQRIADCVAAGNRGLTEQLASKLRRTGHGSSATDATTNSSAHNSRDVLGDNA